ncbi:FmdB family zinc ribbon protein [Heliophilum fasciatum]|uniref:Putative FmdB family regulatory protein n=1 Tax=Heliophilum fasciatum TaxID=35700 RepID=A0A4R2RM96_9FIRM|nr:zinc ribbon domain-containing protein [Heliophilum fasciatum]MCW2278348.1 putative FmdB family regulatory protein [Heliophilum fasciatum]TCP63779.1 putative FmdB family regulatory protein [Heliophilum fasciatum]
MPIYEYRCLDCGKVFSLLRSYQQRDDQALCPHCQSDQLKRLMSSIGMVSVKASGGSCASGDCASGACDFGSCSTGACGFGGCH